MANVKRQRGWTMPKDEWARSAREKTEKKAKHGRNYGPTNTRKIRRKKRLPQWPKGFGEENKI